MRTKTVKDSSQYAKKEVGDRFLALYSEGGEEYPAAVRFDKKWESASIINVIINLNKEVPWQDMKILKTSPKLS